MCIFCQKLGTTTKAELGIALPFADGGTITICADHLAEFADGFEKHCKYISTLMDNNMCHVGSELTKETVQYIAEKGITSYGSILSSVHSTVKDTKLQKNAILSALKTTDTDEVAVVNRPNVDLLDPKAIKAYLDKYIVGQMDAKITLATAVSDHYGRLQVNSNIGKSNVLIIGPSGSGKTYLAEKIAELIDVPFASSDASSLTAEGYVGKSVNTLLLSLYKASKNSIEKAERGIIYLDEIDKIAGKDTGSKDVGGQCVQEQLLRMLQGDTVEIEVGEGPLGKSKVSINTKNILFICSGAFEGLEKIVNKDAKRSVGFSTATVGEADKKLSQIPTTKDLMEYGMDRQFLGRLPIITAVDKLTKAEIKDIISKPKDSILNEYRQQFSLRGVDLKITSGALDKIADIALEQEIGARGIRRIMENILKPYKFNITDYSKTGELKIGKSDIVANIRC